MAASWGLWSTILGFLAVCLLMVGWGRGESVTSKQLSLLAVLAAFCAAGRAVTGVGLLFLQPTMFLVEITGFVFGVRSGFFVGAVTPLVSNFFMGQGPWTPWQMLSWGLVGAAGGFLKVLFPRAGNGFLTLTCFCWGYLYGAIMDIWHWSVFVRPLTLKTYFLTWVAGFGFDSLRALGNLLFCAALGQQTRKILEYFRRKTVVEYVESL